MRNGYRIAVVANLVSLGLVAGLTAADVSPAGAAAAASTGRSADHRTEAKARFTPRNGPTFNNPYGGLNSTRAIKRKLLKAIDATPRRSDIRIASWNVRSRDFTAALLRAHRRGVSVQVVMDNSNWNPRNPNPDTAVLKAGLAQGNKRRKPERRSWLRRCFGACRGPHGIAHTKFFLFSKSGKAEHVVAYGSNNATDLAATIQWNDIFTKVGNEELYDDFEKIFRQMSKDHAPKNGAYRMYEVGGLQVTFYPNLGTDAPAGDPALAMLNKTQCRGATGPGTVNGRTKIRIAQTAMHGVRGSRLANRLAQMRRRGCDIRIVYAMFGDGVLRVLRGAHIPLTHLAWDRDEDGIYDRYLHMKAMTINGVYAGETDATVTVNGSANWTATALASDEVVGVLQKRSVNRRYRKWIDFLFTHRPASWGKAGADGGAAVERRARAMHVDPYALIKQDL
jgi:phosphatidylserine/phosphatidylglycerophosphate/cardiolipin synthase-like enzyme